MASVVCEAGWSNFQGACYRRLDNYTHRSDCEKECSEQGGLLTSIHSAAENNFVYSLMRPPTVSPRYLEQSTWIGGNSNSGWLDGSAWDYENWHSGEPGQNGIYDCITLGNYPDHPDQWLDGVCNIYTNYTTNYRIDCICRKYNVVINHSNIWSVWQEVCYDIMAQH